MKIRIPDDVVADQIIPQFVQIAVSEFEKRMTMLTKTMELPPYPNKTEVKTILGMGDDMLKDWIADGLPVIPWSKKEDRFDRDDIRAHINNMKIQGCHSMTYTYSHELLINTLAKEKVRDLQQELYGKGSVISDRQREALIRECREYQELLYQNRLNRQLEVR